MQENKKQLDNLSDQESVNETPVIDINRNQDNTKPESKQETTIKLLEQFCVNNKLNMQDVAHAIDISLKNQINLNKKERDMFTTAKQQHVAKVEYKELIAREVKAQEIIDKHATEMKKYQTEIINYVLSHLQLTAKTEEEIKLVTSVSELFGKSINDIKAANEAIIFAMAERMVKELQDN